MPSKRATAFSGIAESRRGSASPTYSFLWCDRLSTLSLNNFRRTSPLTPCAPATAASAILRSPRSLDADQLLGLLFGLEPGRTHRSAGSRRPTSRPGPRQPGPLRRSLASLGTPSPAASASAASWPVFLESLGFSTGFSLSRRFFGRTGRRYIGGSPARRRLPALPRSRSWPRPAESARRSRRRPARLRRSARRSRLRPPAITASASSC